MDARSIADLISGMLWNSFWVCLPLLAIGLIVGVVVSLLQIVTSIQDPSFSAVPRLIGFFVAILIFLPWMLLRVSAYATHLFSDLSRYAH